MTVDPGQRPRLSILMPIFNAGPYLAEAVASVADQLIPGDELLVQDGGSTDGSVDALAARYPSAPWLQIVSEQDNGQADALDRALARATHDYFMWLNGDDIVYPDALGAVRDALANRPDLVCGRSTIFNNSGRIVRIYTPRPITRRAMVGLGVDFFTGSLAYRTELVRDVGGFDARYQYCMDIDLMSRLAETPLRNVHISDVVAGLRWHSESKGGSTLWPIVRELADVRLQHARGTGERALAIAASALYLGAGLFQPLRHSRPYSAVRHAVRRRTSPASAPDRPL